MLMKLNVSVTWNVLFEMELELGTLSARWWGRNWLIRKVVKIAVLKFYKSLNALFIFDYKNIAFVVSIFDPLYAHGLCSFSKVWVQYLLRNI